MNIDIEFIVRILIGGIINLLIGYAAGLQKGYAAGLEKGFSRGAEYIIGKLKRSFEEEKMYNEDE